MKFKFLFLFLFFISCSSKNNELLVDINSFKNQGKQIFFKDSIEDSKEIFIRNRISLFFHELYKHAKYINTEGTI